MSSFIVIPLKKTQAIDFIKPLSSYIKNTFSGEVLNENKDSLAELNQLRGNAVVRSLDKHETSLEVLQRYYDQLVNMEAKLPITEDQIRVSLTWYDAFDKGSIFGATKCSLSSGAYEKFCVLFNIGGLMSQIAHSQNQSSDDGLKTAAKYFQRASGIYSYLKDNVNPVLQMLPTPDLSVSCLTALSAILVAQAQDCIFIKASKDQMKDGSLAKIAMQAADYYQEAHRAASYYEVKGMWDKEWLPVLQSKQSYFIAAAEFHQSNVVIAAGKYGEQVSRLQKAAKYIAEAQKQGANYTPACVKILEVEITKKYTLAKKDNELIYLEKVPNMDTLSAVTRAPLAKSLPFTSPMSSNFQDLFNKLLPMAVLQGVSAYDSAKANVINTEVGKMREATQFLNGILASLNLPAAIEDLSGQSCPQSLLDKASELKHRGGLTSIDQMMENLPDLLSRNREILDEAFRLMDDEERDDKQMRDHFQERWTRTPSNKLTQQLYTEGNKYRAILDNATSADGIVKEKYNTHRRSLEILSKSNEEISACLPKGDVLASGACGDAVNELRSYMNQVDELKKQRETLEEEFKGASVNMQSKFLQALAAEGYVDTERITKENIDELFGEYRKQVEENVNKQEELVKSIQASNDSFVAAKQGSNASMNPRDQMLKDLAAAFDAFVELSGNLREGSKFYNDFTEILLKYQSKVNDLVFARKTEKEDLSKDLQQQAAKGTGGAPPAVPTHHQDKPARPPPPVVQQAPPAEQRTPQQPPSGSWQQQPNPTQQQVPQQAYAPYPTAQQGAMPHPSYYAPPSGYYVPPQPYYPPPPQAYGQFPPRGQQYIPPYAQQQQPPPMGYQGYPYQQPPRPNK